MLACSNPTHQIYQAKSQQRSFSEVSAQPPARSCAPRGRRRACQPALLLASLLVGMSTWRDTCQGTGCWCVVVLVCVMVPGCADDDVCCGYAVCHMLCAGIVCLSEAAHIMLLLYGLAAAAVCFMLWAACCMRFCVLLLLYAMVAVWCMMCASVVCGCWIKSILYAAAAAVAANYTLCVDAAIAAAVSGTFACCYF